jgi:transglutaminase-like putative cysteine protease
MRKRIWFSAMGLLIVGLVLAGLLGVIDTLAVTPPLPVSQPSTPQLNPNSGVNPGNQGNIDFLKDISPEGDLPPHIPLFEVTGGGATSLLRSTATLSYDGKVWHFPASSVIQDYTGGKINPPVAGYARKILNNATINTLQDFGAGTTALPTSLYPVSVDSPVPLSYLPEDQLFVSDQGLPESYSFQSASYQFDQSTLKNAVVAKDEKYLQLPSQITERTHQLAQDITAGITSPYQKAQNIQDYLKENYSYDFDYKPAPEAHEPNDWFLFEEKKGVCANFNSAFVALARSAGLPSRLVGGYAIKPGLDAQTVYADQAHAWSEVEFQNIGWQTFDATPGSSSLDATVSPLDLAPTTTEITSVSSIIKKGKLFNVQGTVISPGTTVEGAMVELFINPKKSQKGGINIGRGTVNAGRFNIECTIPDSEDVGNYQLLAHTLNSVRFQESWSDPRIKVTAETRIKLEMPDRIKINDPLWVKGTLIELTEKPVGGQEIKIAVNGDPVTQVITDRKGEFSWGQKFASPGRYSLDSIFTETEFYTGVRQQASFDVLLPTVITLKSPVKAPVQENVTLTGELTESVAGNPVNGQGIFVFVNNQLIEKDIVTDSKGKFTFQQSFDKTGIYQVEVVSDFTGRYWESRHSSAIEIIPVERQFPWLFLILALAVLAGASGLYFRYTRMKSGAIATAGSATATVEVPFLPELSQKPIPAAVLQIKFPGIVTPFPDVWGINEEFEFGFELTDPSGRPLAGCVLKNQVNGRNTELTTDDNGRARRLQTFSQKAVYNIEASYVKTGDTVAVKASRTIMIVDYREEIVELFRLLKVWFTEKGLSFPLEATPRELQDIVSASELAIPPVVLATLINYFEEADYSLHPVTRENYLKMYLVQREIRQHGR